MLKYNVLTFRKAVAFQGYMLFPAIEHVMTAMQYVWQNESVLFLLQVQLDYGFLREWKRTLNGEVDG